MKNVIYLLAALFIAVAAAFFLSSASDPGHVKVTFGHWAIETSLFVMGFMLLLAFIVFYFVLRLIDRALNLPGSLLRKGGDIKANRSQKALISGLIDSAEGNWEKAEKSLIRHVADSGTPLIHYLIAAEAAQSRGAYDKRDEYLQLAKQSTPGSELAVGLTQAELNLSHNQLEQALANLTELESIQPSHAAVLKRLHTAYEKMGDWESLRNLIPALQKNRVLMEAEVKLLETETYSALLKKHAESGDNESLRSLWPSVPGHIKKMPGVNAIYYAGMIENGLGAEIEDDLRNALSGNWNETLLVLYGHIESNDPNKQIRAAEKWLSKRPNDAILLRVLGKLSIQCQQLDKAEKYLGGSIGIEPSVDAYLKLGDLFDQRGDKDKASECYRRGLMLASDEVVKSVDESPSSEERAAAIA